MDDFKPKFHEPRAVEERDGEQDPGIVDDRFPHRDSSPGFFSATMKKIGGFFKSVGEKLTQFFGSVRTMFSRLF